MGDDTWTTVYPHAFEPDMLFPFDSFNVEDLHTVDEGVIANIFPLLQKNMTGKWDLLIGHFLGVDHVGHRLGPAHPTMRAKLNQMNEVLTQVVDLLDDDTLLVVIGDHGMDRKGDHGGDGEHETSAATWIYSKSRPLSSINLPEALIDYATFPGAPSPHRRIQQIDLLPSLSLLLGLPIPFNNLGSIIPELFARGNGSLLKQALRLNAEQVRAYLNAYRSSPSGGELDAVWHDLQHTWSTVSLNNETEDIVALQTFTRLTLKACRSLWAQFNVTLMSVGLVALGLGSATSWALYSSSSRSLKYWDENGWAITARAILSSIAGGILGGSAWIIIPRVAHFASFPEAILIGAVFASSLTMLLSVIQRSDFQARPGIPLSILGIHAVSFLSNSFTFWEDRILTFLLMTSIIPFAIAALSNPQADPKLRNRILGFAALFALCIRLASISTACREEQHPYCHVTFYASSTLPPLLAVLTTIPMSLLLPSILKKFLAISASDKGPAPIFINWGFRASLVAGSVCWILEWLESFNLIGYWWLRAVRTAIARLTIVIPVVTGSWIWWTSSLCLELRPPKELYGFANSYGSTFMLFLLVSYVLVNITQQLAGQLTFALCVIALFALLEVIDSTRDLRQLTQKKTSDPGSSSLDVIPCINYSEVVPIALLSLLAFYSTGHQATMQSLQWKAAFLFTPVMAFHVSLVTMVLNTLGPQLFFSIAVPILAQWKIDPIARVSLLTSTNGERAGRADTGTIFTIPHVVLSSLRAALGMSLYFSVLLFSTAGSAAFLRRHLMVWKVFAPRFMFAAVGMLVTDFGVLLGVAVGVGRTISKVQLWFTMLLQKNPVDQRVKI